MTDVLNFICYIAANLSDSVSNLVDHQNSTSGYGWRPSHPINGCFPKNTEAYFSIFHGVRMPHRSLQEATIKTIVTGNISYSRTAP